MYFGTPYPCKVSVAKEAKKSIILIEVLLSMNIFKENSTADLFTKYRCIHQLFEEQVKQKPSATAVEFEEQQLTYAELNRRANQVAHYLQKKGVKPDELVGIFLERSVETLIGILGILKSGGAYVPMEPILPKERLAFILEDTQVSLLITRRHLLENLPTCSGEFVFVDEWQTFTAESEENPTSDATPENLAYIIYTSGSTGTPKGVMVQHCGVDNMVQAQVKFFNVRPESRILQFYSFAFDASIFETFMALLTGATLFLETRDTLMQGSTLANLLREKRITSIQFPPSILELMPSENLPDLEVVMVGGEVYPSDLVARWAVGRRLFNVYGPTEATVWAAVYERIDDRQKLPIGQPIPNTQIYILDSNLQPVPVGVAGEICISGVGVARGYLNRPELTSEKFIPNPFTDRPEAGLYRTGDYGRYSHDGNIEFLGRIDHQVKIRGFRVELGEIEWVLQSYPGIREVVVVAKEDNLGGRRLIAYLVSQEEVYIKEIRSFLKEKLPDYMMPSLFVTLDSMPRTPNDKVDRNALPDPNLVQSESKKPYVTPRTSLEQEIAEIWMQVMNLEKIGVDDNFFDLGGHSLLATRIIMRLRETLKVELPLRCLFECPTVEGLAQIIKVLRNQGLSAVVTDVLDLKKEAELSFDIYPSQNNICDFSKPNNIFLTGATGFLGAFLLDELLQKTSAEIYCLVRSQTPEEGIKRIQANLEKYSLFKEDYSYRIKAIVGDLSKPFFGLSSKDFNNLANKIDIIYHNGAWVNFIEPYSRLKAANVLGTQEVLKLACKGKVKPLHYISSSSIFGAVRYSKGIEVIKEDDDIELGLGLGFGGYVQSKWAAEKMIWNAKERSLPVTVFRCARVMGHSKTGVANAKDFLSILLQSCIQLGSFYDLEDTFDNFVTVDFASQAIVHLSLKKESLGKPFHIVNPHPIKYSEFWNLVCKYGYSLEKLSYEDWLRKLLAHIKNFQDISLYTLVPLFLENISPKKLPVVKLFQEIPIYESRNVIEGLSNSSITCPKVEEALVFTWLSYFVCTNFLEAPKH